MSKVFPIKKEGILLLLILLVGLVLRFLKWPDYLVFDYEKVRDLLASISIFQEKKLTLLGPTTEVDGVFQGPLYYYLIGFFYFVSNGDPRAGSIVSLIFNLFGVVVIYLMAKDLFGKTTALIASFFYAISFESISYAYWVSNPVPSAFFILLMFFFFYKFLTFPQEGYGKYLPLSLLSWGLAIHFQLLNVIFLPSLLILYFLSRRPRVSFRVLLMSIVGLVVPLISFLFFEVRHNFLMSRSAIERITISQTYVNQEALKVSYLEYFPRFFREISLMVMPTFEFAGSFLALVILGTILWNYRKTRSFHWLFLLIWTFSTLPIFFINSRMSQSHAAFIGVSGAVLIAFAHFLNSLMTKSKMVTFLLLSIVFLSNIYAANFYIANPKRRLFDFFQGLFLKTNLELVDYTYNDVGREKFKVDTVTSPLFISPLWDYLYEWRGRTKYRHQPVRNEAKIGFLIIEPHLGASEIYKDKAIKKADEEGKMVDSHYFGSVAIQKRILK